LANERLLQLNNNVWDSFVTKSVLAKFFRVDLSPDIPVFNIEGHQIAIPQETHTHESGYAINAERDDFSKACLEAHVRRFQSIMVDTTENLGWSLVLEVAQQNRKSHYELPQYYPNFSKKLADTAITESNGKALMNQGYTGVMWCSVESFEEFKNWKIAEASDFKLLEKIPPFYTELKKDFGWNMVGSYNDMVVVGIPELRVVNKGIETPFEMTDPIYLTYFNRSEGDYGFVMSVETNERNEPITLENTPNHTTERWIQDLLTYKVGFTCINSSLLHCGLINRASDSGSEKIPSIPF